MECEVGIWRGCLLGPSIDCHSRRAGQHRAPMLVHKCSRLTAALLPATLISNPQDDDVRHYVKIYGKKVEKVRTWLLARLTRRCLLFRLGLPGLF